MSETLELEKREKFGSAESRRLRWSGKLPAVLYGHGAETEHFVVPADQLRTSLRHGAQVVQLEGAASGQALFQEIQWDVFQQHVLHVDLLRVKKGERITVTVPVQTRGVAPGEASGGIVEQPLHEIEIETSPAFIPEALYVNINQLELHGSLNVSDIEDLPEGAKFVTETDQLVIRCIEPVAPLEEDEEAALESGAEPEVIGGKPDDEEGADKSE